MSLPGSVPALCARGLRFSYRHAAGPALRGVDLDLGPGERGLLLGPTGAGKTTLARVINGTIPRFFAGRLEGTLHVAGHDAMAMTVPALSRLAGVVYQDFESQILSTSCLLDVAFAMESRCVPPGEIRERSLDLLARVGLEGFASRDPSTLSGGEKQRLVIASVLALEAPLLVLDEPASDLDPAARETIYRLVDSLREEAILVVDHDLEGLPFTGGGLLLDGGEVVDRWAGSAGLPGRAARLESAGVRPPPIALLAARLAQKRGGEPRADPGADPGGFARQLRASGWFLRPAAASPPARVSPTEPLLRCERVSHVFGAGGMAVRAVDDVSFDVGRGERLFLIGANGSGKTTLARHLNGLLSPTTGRVLWKGEDVRGLDPRRRAAAVGFVFQNPDHQIFASTLREEAAFGPAQLGLGASEAAARGMRSLEELGLGALAGADPFSLTKGERQRLAVASVLACEPEVILLDEPTTGLDLRQQREVMAVLDRLQERGHALILITHALWMIDERADRVLVMSHGRLLADGRPGEILMDERLMASAGLRIPDLARFAMAWGAPLMSLDRWAGSLLPGEPGAGA